MTRPAGTWARAAAATRRTSARGRTLAEVFRERPVGRALTRYLNHNGNVLAGGIAYYSLASIAAALVLAVSVTTALMGGDRGLREAITDVIGEAIPGVFAEGDTPGIVNPDTLQPEPMTGLVGVIALLVLLYTATRYMRGMRAGVRTMLGDHAGKSIPGTLRDLAALLGLALIALVAAIMQVLSTNVAQLVSGILGNEGPAEATIRLLAAAVGFLADLAFVALIYLVLGQAQVRLAILAPTMLVTVIIILALQQLSSYFVQSASNNPVLAPFAAIIALLLFVDLTARVLLGGAAWMGAASGEREGTGAGLLPPPPRRNRGGVTTRRATGRDPQ